MKNTIGSEIVEGLQEFADALKNDEVITERFTCRRVVLDLEPAVYKPEDVKQARDILRSSQALFAKFLGVSVKTVRAWEQGKNSPNEIACRFMDEIRRDPEYWQRRMRESATIKKAVPMS